MYEAINVINGFKRSITHWFQPIYNIEQDRAIGHEALMRDKSRMPVSPTVIFEDADRDGYRNILDFVSIRNAIKAFSDDKYLLFVNAFPSTLLQRNFLRWWDRYISALTPIILEITESEPVLDWEGLKAVVKELKDRGVRIAIDDMGAGHSSYRHWVELDPAFIKLDRYYAEQLSTDNRKQMIVKSLAELFCGSSDVIIEGIETEDDLNTLRLLGITYAQGYFLGRPAPIDQHLTEDRALSRF